MSLHVCVKQSSFPTIVSLVLRSIQFSFISLGSGLSIFQSRSNALCNDTVNASIPVVTDGDVVGSGSVSPPNWKTFVRNNTAASAVSPFVSASSSYTSTPSSGVVTSRNRVSSLPSVPYRISAGFSTPSSLNQFVSIRSSFNSSKAISVLRNSTSISSHTTNSFTQHPPFFIPHTAFPSSDTRHTPLSPNTRHTPLSPNTHSPFPSLNTHSPPTRKRSRKPRKPISFPPIIPCSRIQFYDWRDSIGSPPLSLSPRLP